MQSLMHNKEDLVKRMNTLFSYIDSDGSGELGFEELQKFMDDQKMKDFFISLDIEPSDAWMLFRLLDTDNTRTIDAEEFVTGCLRLKGSAKAFDMATIRYETKFLTKTL